MTLNLEQMTVVTLELLFIWSQWNFICR